MTKNYLIIFVGILSIISCQKNREIKHSGFDDLVVGSETINLYKNGEFSLEMGLGFQEGTYKIKGDTVLLSYNKTVDLPKKFLLQGDKFESIDFNRTVTIKRTDKNKSESQLKKTKELFNQKKGFQVIEIIKSNDYPSSDLDTSACINWILNKSEIKKIIKESKPINGPEWHHFFGHFPCRIHGKIIQNSTEFDYSINSGAWVSISTVDTTLMFGSFKKENNKYFLATAWTEEMEEKE